MPLHGKIVVIRRNGGDGTEFPLTASCLFGRKPECDIRIQLPQVSKEHCRIEFNENKEIILTNLSSVNPTRVNGEVMQQSERLKDGDVITIIDRSFRFEYPPAPTPKKRRSSSAGRTEKLQVLQDQQVRDSTIVESGEKKISALSEDPHLKDGTNSDNIQRILEKTAEMETKEDESLQQCEATSPFSELYQMIKQTLSASQPQTPASRFCTPKPGSVRKTVGIPTSGVKATPKKSEVAQVENKSGGTPKMSNKQQESFDVLMPDMTEHVAEEVGSPERPVKPATPIQETPRSKRPSLMSKVPSTAETSTPSPRRSQITPQKFTASEVVEMISAKKSMTPTRKRSTGATAVSPAVAGEKEKQDEVIEARPSTTKPEASPRMSPRTSPRSAKKLPLQELDTTSSANGKSAPIKRRRSCEVRGAAVMTNLKKKRVSFGGHLSPELFDKRLPPDSPLRRGATPRRSLCVSKPKQSLLRQASVISLIQEQGHPSPASAKLKSPAKARTPSTGKQSPKARLPSTKTASPGKQSPKARTPSTKTPSPGKQSPKARTPSTKTPSPGKQSPKARTPSTKTPSPGKQSPKARTPSTKTSSPGKQSPKARTPSTKTSSPGKQSPKARTPSPKTSSPGKQSPKARTPSIKTPSPGKPSPKARRPSTKTPSPGKQSTKARTPSPGTAGVETSPGKKALPAAVVIPSPARGRSLSERKAQTPAKSTLPAKPWSADKKSLLAVVGSTPATQENTPAAVAVTPIETPKRDKNQTPTVRGRFSVSRISTPSPSTEQFTTASSESSVQVTPKLPLKRTSMKATPRQTPKSAVRSIGKVMLRRSGVSRASLKALKSWADIVRFGKNKPQVGVPAKKTSTRTKTRKAFVPKPKTPAKRLKDHISTGHADSPDTIVVGKAHKQKVVQPHGAAPQVVHNIALLKKNMKMDEDLTGISEIFSTPVTARKNKSVVSVQSTTETPPKESTSVMEGTVMNTPEEFGEMMVSPLSVASTVKCTTYNSEAVHRLLHGSDDSSFVSETVVLDLASEDSSEQPCPDVNTEMSTPKQSPAKSDCFTGVKRLLKTPQQKAEPVEDLRGRLLRTPRQKSEQPQCLSAVKRIMKTPKQKAEPVEDLWGRLLKTPKVPRDSGEADLDGVKELLETPTHREEPNENLPEVTATNMPQLKSSPMVCATGTKRMMKTPKRKAAPVEEIFGIKRQKVEPVEDMVGVKRLMKTPKETSEPVEENFGLRRLMKSPRRRGASPVEDFVGLQELMEEPAIETNEGQDKMNQECESVVTKVEPEVASEVQSEEELCAHGGDGTSNMETVLEADMEQEPEDVSSDQPEEAPRSHVNVPSDNTEHHQPEETTQAGMVAGQVTEEETAKIAPKPQKKSARGKKTEEVPSPPPVRKTRSRGVKSNNDNEVKVIREGSDSVPSQETVSVKTRRGRAAKQASVEATSEHTPPVDTVNTETAVTSAPLLDAPPEEVQLMTENSKAVSDQPLLTDAHPLPVIAEEIPTSETESTQLAENKVTEDTAEAVEAEQEPQNPVRTKRGRKTKQTEEKVEDGGKIPPSVAADVKQPAEKSRRTRKTKQDPEVQTVENHAAEKSEVSVVADKKQETTELPGETGGPAPVRGRRGKKTEEVPPPPVRKTTRGRGAKSNKDNEVTGEGSDSVPSQDTPSVKPKRGRAAKQASVEKADALQETAVETTNDQSPRVDTLNTETAVTSAPLLEAPPSEEARVVTENTETVSDQPLLMDAHPNYPLLVIAKETPVSETGSIQPAENKATEDTVEAVEAKQEPQNPVTTKRGRKTKQTEEKVEDDGEIPPAVAAEINKPAEKSKRTRKTKQDPKVQMVENPAAEKAEASVVAPVALARRGRRTKQEMVEDLPVELASAATLTEAVNMCEQTMTGPTEKPRRGRRETKQDSGTLIQPETTEVQDKPMEKPKRDRRARQTIVKNAEVVQELPEEKAEPEQQQGVQEEKVESARFTSTNAAEELDVPAVKSTRGKKASSAVKEVSQATPVRRARRGTAPTAADMDVTMPISTAVPQEKAGKQIKAKHTDSPADVVKAPTKRGRKAAIPPAETSTTIQSTEKIEEEVGNVETHPVKDQKKGVSRRVKATSAAANDKAPADIKSAAVEATKPCKKTVNWKEDLTVMHQITDKPPAARATRGTKAKGDKDDASQEIPAKRGRRNVEPAEPAASGAAAPKTSSKRKTSGKTEEKALSGEVVLSEPIKKPRRGVKNTDAAPGDVAPVAEGLVCTPRGRGRAAKKASEVEAIQAVEAETQPRTRGRRTAKK